MDKADKTDKAEVFYELVKNSAWLPVTDSAQSYLLCSKDSVALMLLARLIIENDGGRISSADVKILPEGEKLAVADIEEVTSNAALTPLEQGYKYYILKNGETLNDASSNKLLKTLEEPPKTTKIIILSDNEYSVLPTIRSRCRIITLPPFTPAQIAEAAFKAYSDSLLLNKAARLSEGSITRFIKAAQGEYEIIEQVVIDTLTGMKASPSEAKYANAILKQKENLNEIIDMFELVLSDALLFNAGAKIKLDYRTGEIAQIAAFYPTDTILRLKPAIDRARQRLKFFGNAASITDEFLFSLLEIRQKCKPQI